MPFEKAGGALPFDVLSARPERASTVITCNLVHSHWNRVFGDNKLTAVSRGRWQGALCRRSRVGTVPLRVADHARGGPMTAGDESPSLIMPLTSSAAGLPERCRVTSLLHLPRAKKTVVEVASSHAPERRLFWRGAREEGYTELPPRSPGESIESPLASVGSTCLFALYRSWSPMAASPSGKPAGVGSSVLDVVRVELAGAAPSVRALDLRQALGPQRSVSRLLSVGANDQHLQMVVMQRPAGAQGGVMKYVIATVGVDGASYTEEDALPGVFF